MNITWLGHACFQIETGNQTVITDPYKPMPPHLQLPAGLSANIVTVSHSHFDHNNTAAIGGSPTIIDQPGVHTVNDIVITGIPTFHDKTQGSERGNNIVFVIEADGIRLCHLGDLGHFLSETQLAELGRIDILLIPVGGHFTLEPEEAAELAEKISAAITIPMHYKTKNIPDNLPIQTAGPFLQAMQRPHQEVNVLTVSADDLRNRQPEVVTLLAVS